MKAAGIDLGGTKIELQLFDCDWQVADRKRVQTPKTYDALVAALVELINWADTQARSQLPIGVGAAGLINPTTGIALTANLCATGRPLSRDLALAVGRHVTYVNDCRALALSEAVFGAGRGHETVLAMILGTGVGGGISHSGSILAGPTATGGEFGHMSAPAHVIAAHGLPIVQCGCGRMGCIETYIAGPGMSRIAQAVMNAEISPPEIIAQRETNPQAAKVWQIWCELTAELLCNLTLAIDPNVFVLGGGLSNIEGVTDALSEAMKKVQLGGFDVAPIVLAEGGDASGARGAAYAAFQEQTPLDNPAAPITEAEAS
ncbi:ROK family protein [Falsihalocynthiibacter sp. SS001]|uniref:ROK family protein n=1 Tax=Falsihalocynthiibacter sp. SS001 TaxID=3349698 RepID=UPI0036D24269